MQPNKTKLALQIGAVVLGALCASNSYADPFQAQVSTLDDVSILTVTALDFGENITTTASGECTMDADQPANTDVLTDANVTATTYGVLTGTNCVGGGAAIGTPGVYSVTGIGGLDVNLTVTTLTQSDDFTFAPQGCGVVHDNAGTDGDVCNAYTLGAPLTMTLANATDNGASSANLAHFTVGGTITVGATGLSSDTNYPVTFNVDVVY
ncbi:hypothetical protein [Brumicola nitratireducens]|uniref:DUF4402 domain-containing protein n=1 Tax=Glaciecola nitratireducens (strain JCM 12485 / KCTC 12276 / FR1064) TaxID=1085623 RepID=G4QKQ7_GLANF|nr:hypothetical protein [Glaciecola nitratireducens]AEP30360.1 hypothetical protein GNIT_2259 [Glaciecola nitratireducens FR1064]